MGELVSNGVQIYQFPVDDETVAELNLSMNVSSKDSRISELKATEMMKILVFYNYIFFNKCQCTAL